MVSTKKTGSQRYVTKNDLFFTNFQSRTPERRHVALLENCVYRGQEPCEDIGSAGARCHLSPPLFSMLLFI